MGVSSTWHLKDEKEMEAWEGESFEGKHPVEVYMV